MVPPRAPVRLRPGVDQDRVAVVAGVLERRPVARVGDPDRVAVRVRLARRSCHDALRLSKGGFMQRRARHTPGPADQPIRRATLARGGCRITMQHGTSGRCRAAPAAGSCSGEERNSPPKSRISSRRAPDPSSSAVSCSACVIGDGRCVRDGPSALLPTNRSGASPSSGTLSRSGRGVLELPEYILPPAGKFARAH